MRISSWIVAVFIALGLFCVSTLLHELAHALMCHLLGCKILGLKALLFCYSKGRISISLKGRNHCAFVSDSTSKMKLIVAAGPLVELAVCIVSLFIAINTKVSSVKNGILGGVVLIILSVIHNMIPSTNGDGKMLFGKEDR